ncbi:hypothetical protein VPH35_116358 [Triticum aestivum]|uniref:Flavin-containing monooxygenase n=1 Tax=Triticum aestivum TaxID=4565 RepID=A0A3B6QFB6_WHEAT|nr:flavin-containing monooxygenase FMO GS-OX-like 4 [Triticum aestivum]
MPSRSLRVAVIGAGAAGLVAARELRREGHAPVVFERTDGVGGTWVYEADADASASPEPLVTQRRSNLDASLRTNLPRECMGFLDFPFVAGPDGDTRRFPGHAEVLRYLQSFARRFDLDGLVRLETEVVRVSRETSGTSWRVRYSRKASGSEKRETDEEVFDAVVICNGHYSQPHFADVAGVDAWPGKQLHSTSYRVPEPFHGQVVVVIGCGPSGTDISRDIAGVAKEVHLASRWSLSATSEKLPGHANMWLHSEIDRAQEDGSVVFHDGSRVKADVIMHCTGYKYNFPFLTNDATVSVDDNCVDPLYKHVFPPQVAPRLSFIGLPLKVVPFPLFELQSHWVAGVLSGRFKLPSKDEMVRDVTAFHSRLAARGWPRRYTHRLRDREFENEDWLAEQCRRGGPEGWRREMFDAAMQVMVERPENYRDEWDGGDYDHLLAQANRDFAAHCQRP